METVTHLADADGHIIEPGDLWVERMPEELRPLAPRFYRDAEGNFHSRIYGIEIESLEVMHGGMRPKDMLENMGLACAMGVPLARVFTGPERERHTILDAAPWARDGRERLKFNTEHGVSRAVLFPTFMLAGGTLLPNICAEVCRVYNDWIARDYCGGSGAPAVNWIALVPPGALADEKLPSPACRSSRATASSSSTAGR